MDRQKLKQMVEIDTFEGKLIKLGEEVTELRFAMQTGSDDEKILECAQALFVVKQLDIYTGRNYFEYIHKMLKKYGLMTDYKHLMDMYDIKIEDQLKVEYKENLIRVGLNY